MFGSQKFISHTTAIFDILVEQLGLDENQARETYAKSKMTVVFDNRDEYLRM